jgi:hypothetical protein
MEESIVSSAKKIANKVKEPVVIVILLLGISLTTIISAASLILATGSVYYAIHPQKSSYCSSSYTFDGKIVYLEHFDTFSLWRVEIQPYRDGRIYDRPQEWELKKEQVDHYNLLESFAENRTINLYKRCDSNCKTSSSDQDQCRGWYFYRQLQQYAFVEMVIIAVVFWFLFFLGLILILGCICTCGLVIFMILIKIFFYGRWMLNIESTIANTIRDRQVIKSTH